MGFPPSRAYNQRVVFLGRQQRDYQPNIKKVSIGPTPGFSKSWALEKAVWVIKFSKSWVHVSYSAIDKPSLLVHTCPQLIFSLYSYFQSPIVARGKYQVPIRMSENRKTDERQSFAVRSLPLLATVPYQALPHASFTLMYLSVHMVQQLSTVLFWYSDIRKYMKRSRWTL